MKNIIWWVVGVLLGFAIGIGYAWGIHPAEFRGAGPDSLRAEYRGEYLLLIASSYHATGDLNRARSRLAEFPGMDAVQLASLAQQVVASGGGGQTAQDLAMLALALGQNTPASGVTAAVHATMAGPTLSTTELAAPTIALAVSPLPSPAALTITPSPTVIVRYVLQSNKTICETAKDARPQIRVAVQSSSGTGIPGVEILVRWPGGQGRMVTGLKPDVDSGYADYDLDAGILYEISLGNGGLTVGNLSAPVCPNTAGPGAVGSLYLIILSQ